ncbi:hypothetical protein [Kitasatospora terrestris]|uniref:FHA domain-containing protein n=1 Tax=Kitasatospora terrestris TaxID=258051 RepID=A0ABP9DDY2_9ACTN
MTSDLTDLRLMARHLEGDPEQADFLLDLSNIVRERSLGGADRSSLHRLRLVLDALRDLTGDREVTVHAIADDNLLNPAHDADFPDPAEPALLREWHDRSLITAHATADPDLLDHAKALGTPVISSDNFKGHRGRHEWIQGNQDRFLKPERVGPSVRLVPRDMRFFADREVSSADEHDRLRAARLLDQRGRPRSDVLEHAWQCPVVGCTPKPALARGKVVCQVHRTLLHDCGPRRPRVQLKITVDGVCRAWDNLTHDDTREFVLGRGHLDRIEDRHLDEDRRRRISRRHLVLVSRHGTLRVLDLSTALSSVRTRRPGGEPTPWEPLPHLNQLSAGQSREELLRAFGPDDEIEIVPGVLLSRSGQRWPGERHEGVRAKPPRRPRDGDDLTRVG